MHRPEPRRAQAPRRAKDPRPETPEESRERATREARMGRYKEIAGILGVEWPEKPEVHGLITKSKRLDAARAFMLAVEEISMDCITFEDWWKAFEPCLAEMRVANRQHIKDAIWMRKSPWDTYEGLVGWVKAAALSDKPIEGFLEYILTDPLHGILEAIPDLAAVLLASGQVICELDDLPRDLAWKVQLYLLRTGDMHTLDWARPMGARTPEEVGTLRESVHEIPEEARRHRLAKVFRERVRPQKEDEE